ncbi:MAG: hypothetical protein ABIC95_06025 [archaeon]
MAYYTGNPYKLKDWETEPLSMFQDIDGRYLFCHFFHQPTSLQMLMKNSEKYKPNNTKAYRLYNLFKKFGYIKKTKTTVSSYERKQDNKLIPTRDFGYLGTTQPFYDYLRSLHLRDDFNIIEELVEELFSHPEMRLFLLDSYAYHIEDKRFELFTIFSSLDLLQSFRDIMSVFYYFDQHPKVLRQLLSLHNTKCKSYNCLKERINSVREKRELRKKMHDMNVFPYFILASYFQHLLNLVREDINFEKCLSDLYATTTSNYHHMQYLNELERSKSLKNMRVQRK